MSKKHHSKSVESESIERVRHRLAYESMLFFAYNKASRPSRTFSEFVGHLYYVMYILGFLAIGLLIASLSVHSLSLFGMGASFASTAVSSWILSRVYGVKADLLHSSELAALREHFSPIGQHKSFSDTLRDEVNKTGIRKFYAAISMTRSKYPSVAILHDLRMAIWFPLILGLMGILIQMILYVDNAALKRQDSTMVIAVLLEVACAVGAFYFRAYMAKVVAKARRELESNEIRARGFLKREDNPPEKPLDWLWI